MKILSNLVDLKNTKRKIIFVGDSFQLSIGKGNESALNPQYLSEKYDKKSKAFQLDDKANKSPIVEQALKAVKCIRDQLFNNLCFEVSESLSVLNKDEVLPNFRESLESNNHPPHILCYSNSRAQKLNFWIKKSIIKNGRDLQPGDLIIFTNNIEAEDKNDRFLHRIHNGQFARIATVSAKKDYNFKLKNALSFREVTARLHGSHGTLKFLSLENFRLSDKGQLSKDEEMSYQILLRQFAEKELDNFKNGKYQPDDELKKLLSQGEKVKTRVVSKIQEILARDYPSTEYFKFKNSAHIRFGWALTVHKGMTYKWDEIFFDTKIENRGRTNKDYFKWVYTSLIRATKRVSLINYEAISPFCKINIKSSAVTKSSRKEYFYIPDTSEDLSNIDKEICEKFEFPEENKSSLLRMCQFVCKQIENQKLKVYSIDHREYKELYQIRRDEDECATVSFSYNKKGYFRMPTLVKSRSQDFGAEVLNILESKNKISDL